MSKRTALIAAGIILTVSGGVAAAGGGAVVAAVGSDSTLSSGRHAITSPTSALVTEEGDIDDFDAGFLGHPGIKLSISGSDKPVFVGVGPAAAVDRYLAGADVETVTDFDVRPFHLTTTVHEGTRQLSSPLDQSFWVAQSEGSSAAATTWKIHDGTYRLVVMNADGSAGIDVDGRIGLHVPRLTAIGRGLLGGGLGVLLIGVTVLVLGLRSRATSTPVETTPQYVTASL
jgi:hypothetical protein